ncbi:MAG: CBS domain-containing protein [Campylobacterales bacterium]|nr:CBS domain-containing protein [Campylobacterales bacterium]
MREALEFVKLKHYKRLIVVDDEGRLNGIITQKELQ